MSETNTLGFNRWFRLRYLLPLAIAALVVMVVSSTQFQIWFHDSQMHAAWDEIYGKPPDVDEHGMTGYTLDADYDRYVYHRQRLLELGGLRELHYRLRNVRRATPAAHQLDKEMLSKNRPTCVDFESPWSEQPVPVELTIWCYPDDAEAWDRFVAEHDVVAEAESA